MQHDVNQYSRRFTGSGFRGSGLITFKAAEEEQ